MLRLRRMCARRPRPAARRRYGDPQDPESARFFYMLHHQLPEAAQQYGDATRAALRMMYGDMTSEGTQPPQITSDRMYVDGVARGMWERGPSPGKLQPWISEEELEYVIGEFEENGWNGGLNWYRVMDINFHATPQLAG